MCPKEVIAFWPPLGSIHLCLPWPTNPCLLASCVCVSYKNKPTWIHTHTHTLKWIHPTTDTQRHAALEVMSLCPTYCSCWLACLADGTGHELWKYAFTLRGEDWPAAWSVVCSGPLNAAGATTGSTAGWCCHLTCVHPGGQLMITDCSTRLTWTFYPMLICEEKHYWLLNYCSLLLLVCFRVDMLSLTFPPICKYQSAVVSGQKSFDPQSLQCWWCSVIECVC